MKYVGYTGAGRPLRVDAKNEDEAWALLSENAAEFGERLEDIAPASQARADDGTDG